jgi:tetratricopeptide (TPR) repeat protein/2-polyprenyl-3-methyl-5-hydroxy-6-metoxy-1,4-benzoquinol methylase
MKRAKKQRPQKKNQKSRRAKKTTPTTSLPFEQPVPDIQQSLEIAVTHHNAGRRDVAEGIYRQILQIDPNQPTALHLLGLLAHQGGNHDAAIDLIGQALAIAPDFAEAHTTLAGTLHSMGRLEEAEASYRKGLTLKPDQPEALGNFGNLLQNSGKLEESIECYQQAVAHNPNSIDFHLNLGDAFRKLNRYEEAISAYKKALDLGPDNISVLINMGVAQKESGLLEDAVSSYQKTIILKPDYTEAHINLSLVLKNLGRLEEALASGEKVLALNPHIADGHNCKGNALLGMNKMEEAVECYRSAVAIDPDFHNAHKNLGNALKELGRSPEAWSHLRRAVALNPGDLSFWNSLADCLESLSFSTSDDGLLYDLAQIAENPTVRPKEIFLPILSGIRQHPDFQAILPLMEKATPDDEIPYGEIAERLSSIPLFLRILALVPAHELEIERFLTTLRRTLLQETMNGTTRDSGLALSSALALQGFTNEYIFFESEEETAAIERLEGKIADLVEKDEVVPAPFVAALGAYRALYQFPWAKDIGNREWAEPINDVVDRLIREPLEEIKLRSDIPCLTPIENEVSQSVREQYEENPYPRWIRTGVRTEGLPIKFVLQSPGFDFDLSDYEPPENPEILVAGCGTGQHSIFTATRFKNCQVLAIDLSLSSLSYAKRKTKQYGISNIDYAQADIMELGILDRQFDIVESSGVLHHLADPVAGWRVLVGLLKTGGLMKIGLYSEIARQDIVSARALIAQKGYSSSAEDIRRCREEIISMAESGDEAMQMTCKSGDFFSLSECRDLIFHVQEHRFTVPQIETALQDLGLDFVGFEIKDKAAVKKINKLSPDSNARNSTALWHEFEQENPDTFRGMYQFWCRKR